MGWLNKKIVLTSFFVSISIVLSYLDFLIPLSIYIKIGLANIVIVYSLYQLSIKNTFLILILRIFLFSFIIGSFFNITFLLSLSGGLTSFTVMALLKKLNVCKIITVSVVGSFVHVLTQLIITSLIINDFSVIIGLSYLLIISFFSGILVGLLAYTLLKKFNPIFNYESSEIDN